MPDRLVARLAAELDAVRPRHPRIAQARHRRASAARAPRRRLGGLATAAAVAALSLVALATLATGSPNPRVWTGVAVIALFTELSEARTGISSTNRSASAAAGGQRTALSPRVCRTTRAPRASASAAAASVKTR